MNNFCYRNGEETTLLNNGPITDKSQSSDISHSKYAYDVFIAKESYTVLSIKSDGKVKQDDDYFDENAVSISSFQLADDNHLRSLKRSISAPSAKCCKSFKESSLWKLLRYGLKDITRFYKTNGV